MATNITQYLNCSYGLSVEVTHPATPSSNDPVLWNKNTGLAITDEGEGGNEDDYTTVQFGDFVTTVRVVPFSGPNDGRVETTGNVGDKVYYDSSASSTESSYLNLNTAGVFFGYLLSGVASSAGSAGAETSVWHVQQ
jgi:hypothetical protein